VRHYNFFEAPQLMNHTRCGIIGAYGEAEFFFASIKVITITGTVILPALSHVIHMLNAHVGLIILGIILDLGGGPDHDRLGFRYWKNPGPFVQYNNIAGAKGRFLGFWAVLTQAAFSFIGTEIVAVSHNAARSCRAGID
jgi:amino acid transporter